MVTFSCCQNCLEHGTSEVDYFHDGHGNAPVRDSDMSVKTNLSLGTDFSFPVYGFAGQTTYMKYYGYATIVEIVGSVFFTLKPDYSLTQGGVLFDAVLTIVPFLAISVLFAYIAGVILWALVSFWTSGGMICLGSLSVMYRDFCSLRFSGSRNIMQLHIVGSFTKPYLCL